MDSEQKPEEKLLQKRTPVKIAGIIFIAIIIAAFWLNNKPDSEKSRGGNRTGMANQPVQVASVIRTNMPVYYAGLGTVTAAKTATVRSQVEGTLLRLHFKEGETVKAGQLLAEIDPRPFQVQLVQAQGQLVKDQAALTNAQQDLKRYETLLQQDSIARQQVDAQRSQVKQLRGAIKSDQAQIANAKLQLTYSRITAPFTGKVGLRQIDQGNLVKAGDTTGIVVITQVQPIDVLFSLPEVQLPEVQRAIKQNPGLVAQAWDRNMDKVLANGTLVSLDNQIDATTGTIKLRAQFSNEDELLFPNQFVNVRLKTEDLQQMLQVPASAIQLGNQGSFVWVVDKESTVSTRNIQTGATDGAKTVVISGLKENERVVTDGVDRLKSGQTVEIIVPGQTKASPARQKQRNTKASAPSNRP